MWRTSTESLRLVLSPALYNAAGFERVLTCQVGPWTATGRDSDQFEPYAVPTDYGPVIADLLATMPRSWLVLPVGQVSADQLRQVRRHLSFITGAEEPQ